MNNTVKKSLFIGIPVALIAVGVALFLILSGGGEAEVELPSISLAQFQQLERDMTMGQVIEILGFEGNLLSATTGEDNDGVSIRSYAWDGERDGARAVLVFNDGLLGAFTHVGLTN
jgi:hypothetical protein